MPAPDTTERVQRSMIAAIAAMLGRWWRVLHYIRNQLTDPGLSSLLELVISEEHDWEHELRKDNRYCRTCKHRRERILGDQCGPCITGCAFHRYAKAAQGGETP